MQVRFYEEPRIACQVRRFTPAKECEERRGSRLGKQTNADSKTLLPPSIASGANILQMTVFKYVEDKDVFQKFYSRMLAKRLVNFTSASDDAETSMIGKLKEACGFEYTNKLQRMFQDMQISKDLNDSYKEWLVKDQGGETQNGVDFSVQVKSTRIKKW